MKPLTLALLALALLLTLLAGCGSKEQETDTARPQADKPAAEATAGTPEAKDAASAGAPEAAAEAEPPAPPMSENFDGEPQLSLFPRVSGSRPEDSDSEGLSYWKTYIDHLLRTCGAADKAGRQESRAWIIRSIKGLDSVAFFSPLAVKPETAYRVSFAFKGELPEGASAGIGVLEFDEFLWIGEQYPESLMREHQTGSRDGVRLQGKQPWKEHAFTFTTTAKSRMIHLVLFRDGADDRKQPVFFDDIRIEEAPAG